MPVRIGDGCIPVEIDGRVVVTAPQRVGGWREVTYWPRFFDCNPAITGLTVTELLGRGPRQQGPTCPCAPEPAAMTKWDDGPVVVMRRWVPMQRIRPAIDALDHELGLKYAWLAGVCIRTGRRSCTTTLSTPGIRQKVSLPADSW